MSLFMQNMKLGIPNNGGKRIMNCIMCGNAFSLMSTKKNMYPYQIYGLVAYASRKTTSHKIQGRPNLVHSAKEKMLKAILKDEMIEHAKSQTPKLKPVQDLSRT